MEVGVIMGATQSALAQVVDAQKEEHVAVLNQGQHTGEQDVPDHLMKLRHATKTFAVSCICQWNTLQKKLQRNSKQFYSAPHFIFLP